MYSIPYDYVTERMRAVLFTGAVLCVVVSRRLRVGTPPARPRSQGRPQRVHRLPASLQERGRPGESRVAAHWRAGLPLRPGESPVKITLYAV